MSCVSFDVLVSKFCFAVGANQAMNLAIADRVREVKREALGTQVVGLPSEASYYILVGELEAYWACRPLLHVALQLGRLALQVVRHTVLDNYVVGHRVAL